MRQDSPFPFDPPPVAGRKATAARRVVAEREMAIAPEEFGRLFRRAFANRELREAERRFSIGDGPRRLDVELSVEADRRLAGLALPVTRVRLTLTGYAPRAAAELIARFDRAFQRGGG